MTDFNIIRCSFCGDTQNQVKKIIAGPGRVFICDTCVLASLEILRESGIGPACRVCDERRVLHDAGRVETQRSIAEWADQTFGPAPSLARIAARANEEMAELLRGATAGAEPAALVEEAADVTIILYRLVRNAGGDLHDAIDGKMAVNRQRQWRKDGTGHAYHVGDA